MLRKMGLLFNSLNIRILLFLPFGGYVGGSGNHTSVSSLDFSQFPVLGEEPKIWGILCSNSCLCS